MSVNLFGAATASTLQQMASDISDMADYLASIQQELSSAPESKPINAPLRVSISSLGLAQSQGAVWQTSDMVRLVGLFIGGQNSGRYQLQIGRTDISQVFWLQASQTQFYSLQGDATIEIGRGLEVTVNSPSSAAWDATFLYYPSDMLPPRAA